MMSDKRFILKADKTIYIVDKEQNHKIRDMYKSCEVLNELAEENEQLKQQLNFVDKYLQKRDYSTLFVVREGKQIIALFPNEQRARYYCEENLAYLTYAREKWERIV